MGGIWFSVRKGDFAYWLVRKPNFMPEFLKQYISPQKNALILIHNSVAHKRSIKKRNLFTIIHILQKIKMAKNVKIFVMVLKRVIDLEILGVYYPPFSIFRNWIKGCKN